MNIFNVHNQIIEEYSKYNSSFLDISNTRIKEAVEGYFKSRKLRLQPLLQFNPSYELSETSGSTVVVKTAYKGAALEVTSVGETC